MSEHKNLKEELLSKMDQSTSTGRNVHLLSAEELIASETTKIRRLKCIVAASWVLFLVFCAVCAFIEIMRRYSNRIMGVSTLEIAGVLPQYDWFPPFAVITTQALLLIAVILTADLHIRSRTLSMHQIQARLANIEALLKNVVRDK